MHVFQQHLSASFNVFHKGKRQAIYEGLCKVGAGAPLSAHAKLHDCGESDGQDRAIVLEEVWLGGGGGWVYLSCFVACILGDEAAQSTVHVIYS